MEADPADFTAVVRPGSPAELLVSGDLDLASVDQFAAAIDELLAMVPEHVTLDLAEVGFIDSTGIKGMVKLANRCRAIGADLTTVNASTQVRRVLELTQLAELFDLR